MSGGLHPFFKPHRCSAQKCSGFSNPTFPTPCSRYIRHIAVWLMALRYHFFPFFSLSFLCFVVLVVRSTTGWRTSPRLGAKATMGQHVQTGCHNVTPIGHREFRRKSSLSLTLFKTGQNGSNLFSEEPAHVVALGMFPSITAWFVLGMRHVSQLLPLWDLMLYTGYSAII